MTPEEALSALLEGNRRFVRGQPTIEGRSLQDLSRLPAVQHPIAAVLSCSDSRVVPEYIFDQPFGSIFVCRSPGNTIGPETLAAIEYSLQYLGTPLVLVLGHTRCGAVTLAAEGAAVSGALGMLLLRIQPAVYRARSAQSDFITAAVEENVRCALDSLNAQSMVLREAVRTGQARLEGAVFELETGIVRLMP